MGADITLANLSQYLSGFKVGHKGQILYEQVKRDAMELEARIASATQELRQRAEELAVLNELSRALAAHLSVEEVLVETHRGAARLMDAANSYITLYDADRD